MYTSDKRLVYQQFVRCVDWDDDFVGVYAKAFEEALDAAKARGVPLPPAPPGHQYGRTERAMRQYIYSLIGSVGREELVAWAREANVFAAETLTDHDLRHIVLYAQVGCAARAGAVWEDAECCGVRLVGVQGGWVPEEFVDEPDERLTGHKRQAPPPTGPPPTGPRPRVRTSPKGKRRRAAKS
jgi:hypothetical protein